MFSRLGKKNKTSREVAKQRLQLVLVHDRNRISPGLLEILKDEIIAVISKHIEIDTQNVQVSISQEEKESRLMADIPLAEGGHLRGSI
jgi:cell division topological specificity factor